MCGIAGIISSDTDQIYMQRIKSMTDIIAHRGPDGDGHWIDERKKVAFGHRRLSIIDLSHEADQPMHYMDRYTIIFNGEIYNYIELKEILIQQGYQFHTQSDTEVLMAMYDREKENCLHFLDGMFAFALYDKQKQEVFIACDRFGEKPFFYNYVQGKHFIFGSEMKCLWAAGIKKEVSNQMLFNYLSQGSTLNPDDLSQTFYQNCTRLPHGHYIILSIPDITINKKQYYNIDWKNIDNDISIDKAAQKFKELFYISVKRRLRSDVTVGSSLSGGLDSSLVVAVIDSIKKGTAQKQDTFSAVFPGFIKDERKYMDFVIAKTNVSPHFVTPTDEGMLDNLDKLCWHQEEPFGSASIYVQYSVMQLAKENNVTVLLDGQGADEILAGYHGYYTEYFKELKKNDKHLYKLETEAYTRIQGNSQINPNLRGSFKDRIKIGLGNQIPGIRKLYHRMTAQNHLLFNNDFKQTYRKGLTKGRLDFNGLNENLEYSTNKYGLQELLRYADRNSMAHSREVRLPFLYHEMVEFLFSLPASMKINEGWTKWIMRKTFGEELPKEIAWRTDKIGYEPPQEKWLNSTIVKDKLVETVSILKQDGILSKKNDPNEMLIKNPNIKWKILMAGQFLKP